MRTTTRVCGICSKAGLPMADCPHPGRMVTVDDGLTDRTVNYSIAHVKTGVAWPCESVHIGEWEPVIPADFTMTHPTIEPIPVIQERQSSQPADLHKVWNIMKVVGEAIRDCGPDGVPSGHLYAVLMDIVPLGGFNSIITALKGAGLVKESGNLLTWVGPTVE